MRLVCALLIVLFPTVSSGRFHAFAIFPPPAASTENRQEIEIASTGQVGFARKTAPFQEPVSLKQPPSKPELLSTTIGGTWTATAGAKRTFRGSWSARTLPAAPNTAQGSWTLLSATNQTLMEGAWSAQQSDGGWHGMWTARVTTGRLRSGRSFSGTWQAALPGFDGRTLIEMLQRTIEAQVSGSWRSQGLSGTWSLRASPSSTGRGSNGGTSSDITR